MYSVYLSLASALIVSLGWRQLDLWGGLGMGIFLGLVAFIATWIVIMRRFSKRIQAPMINAQKLAESMLVQGTVHFLATDAHSPTRRRPLMRRAYQRICELTDERTASLLCMQNPAQVARGETISSHLSDYSIPPRGWHRLFSKKKAG